MLGRGFEKAADLAAARKMLADPRTTMTRTRLPASAASNATRNCSRWFIVMTLSGGRSRTMSRRWRAASTSTRKPSSPSDFPEPRGAAWEAREAGVAARGTASEAAGSGSATRRAGSGMGSLLLFAPARRFAVAALAALSGAPVFMARSGSRRHWGQT
jgi:hypothetical protein